jgi:hypothetical protein
MDESRDGSLKRGGTVTDLIYSATSPDTIEGLIKVKPKGEIE